MFAFAPGGGRTLLAAESLETIIVTAPRERTGDVVIDDHAGTHTRIDGNTLQRHELSLDDILAREAGVQRRRSGGLGSYASITVRAASPAQTTILLDGVRLNTAGAPVVDLSLFEASSFESIDIYRSATPLQFGQSNIGGAINLVTPRSNADAPRSRVGLSAASFGTLRGEATHIGKHGRWDTVAALGLSDSDNDFTYVDDNGTPLNRDDDQRQRRHNAAAQRVGLLAKVGTGHDSGARSDILLQLGERRLGVPEFRNSADNDAHIDSMTRQLQVVHRRDTDHWLTAHTIFFHDGDARFDDSEGDIGLGAQLTSTRTRQFGIDSYWRREIATGTIELKGEGHAESLNSRDRLRNDSDVDATRRLASLNAKWTRYAGEGRWVLALATRLQHIDDRIEQTLRETPSSSRISTSLLPSLSVRHDHSDTLMLHASLEQSRREPSFDELFIDRGLVRGNPELTAEHGLNVDLGLRWSPASTTELSAALFASRRKELIVRTFDARGVGRAINIGRAQILGVELGAAWAPTQRWQLDANATFQDAGGISENRTLDGKQLPGEAQVQIHLGLQFRPRPRWRLRGEAERTEGRWYDQANKRPALDSTHLTLALDYQRAGWRIATAIDNIGNDNVEDFNGFPRPGRSFSLHLTHNFEHTP